MCTECQVIIKAQKYSCPLYVILTQGSHRPGKVLEFDLGPGKLLEFENSAFCPGIVLEF